ncbi:ImmA/IrrE family metallo-endopeptidase [Microbacterium sp. 2MCAF23]|uniref:ImmA/IrrE family metallo-endopeptidase n=1 Tax=Microbacterium sp. 2MCAF23 TaxID=3232985 RepID=UPI003F99765B
MNIDRAVARLIQRLPEADVLRFAADPGGAVEPVFGVRAVASAGLAETRGAGGACDGVSFLEDGVLFYAPTPHSNRHNFTIAHEVGHHLVNSDDDVANWIYDQDDHEAILETVCDRVAQSLLLPPASVKQFLDGRVPRARDVLDLYEGSSASRPVCAIAIAQHLPHFGAVVLIERQTMTVTSASIHADPEHGWPFIYPWPGQQVPAGHQLRNVGDGVDVVRRASWPGRFGSAEEFYLNAVGAPNGIVAVFSGEDLWGVPELPRLVDREWDSRPLLSGTCCGESFQRRGYPCPACKKPYCPRCGKCPHERSDSLDVVCTACFCLTPRSRIVDGVCSDCRA